MKINVNDFKHLPNRKKIAETLKALSMVKEGDSPFPVYHELMHLVSQTNAQESIPAIFPYLVGLAMESKDFTFVNFVVTLKLGFYHRGRLDELSDQELRHYVAALHNLKGNLPLGGTKNLEDWEEDFKSLYVWNTFMIHSYSPDILVFSRQGKFDKAFKVKCTHCGNDIHSLYLDLDDLKGCTAITPAERPEKPWNMLFCHDVYSAFFHLCVTYEELYFSTILPYVYGTYPCSVCHEKSVVIEAMKAYQLQEEPWFIPSDAFLSRLSRGAKAMSHEIALEKWVFSTFVFGQYVTAYGPKDSRGMTFMLEIAESLGAELPDRMFLDLLEEAKELEFTGEFAGTVCRVSGGFYRRQEEGQEKALSYYQQGILMAGKSKSGRKLHEEYVLYLAEISPEKGEKAMIDYYESLETPEEEGFLLKIEKELADFYCKQGNLSQAIHYQKKLVAHCEERYGANSEITGEYTTQLGAMYLEEGQLALAKDCCNKALGHHLAFLGQIKPLPKPLGKGRKKVSETILGENPDMGGRGRLGAMTLVYLGHIALKEGSGAEAVLWYKKAAALWDWVSLLPFVEQGNHFLYQAQGYQALGKKAKAKSMAKKALAVYESRLKESKVAEELEECRRNRPLAQEMIAE